MNVTRYGRLKELFAAGSALPAAARAEWLAALGGADTDLVSEVRRMLVAADRDSPLDRELVPGFRDRLANPQPDAALHALPERLGNYRLLGELGRGGMGVVYEAEQENPQRRVALKVLGSISPTPTDRARFVREAAALARLQHPGIAKIYEAGVAETAAGAVSFLAMERIEGLPLTAYATANGLDRRARIELLAAVCDAVDHAHRHGVVHRDLKPTNVLVTESDAGKPAPKVLDFGVAQVRGDGAEQLTLHTTPGLLIGTLAYASPEQVSGRGHEVDGRSDCYALGMMLYELLTGRLPYDTAGCSVTEAIRVVCEAEPGASSELRGEIEVIVRKALAKEPARRYATAAALAADLRANLEHRPIAARPPSRFYLARKFARRHRGFVAGAVLALVALLSGLVASLVHAHAARRAASQSAAVLAGLDALLTLLDTNPTRRADLRRTLGPAVSFGAAIKAWAAGFADRRFEVPLVEAEIRMRVGRALFHAGDWPGAVAELERAVPILARELGPDAASTLEAETWLAWSWNFCGYPDKAQAAMVRVTAGLERLHGPAAPETHWAHMCAGLCAEMLGDPEGSVTLMRETLARLDARRVDAPRFMLQSILAEGLALTGHHDEALTLIGQSLASCREEAGPRHFGHGILPYVYALVLLQRSYDLEGRGAKAEAEPVLRAAEEHCRAAIAFAEQVTGSDSDWTWYMRNELGIVLGMRGAFAEAIDLQRKVLAWRVARFGAASPPAWNIRRTVVWGLARAGRNAEFAEFAGEIARLALVQCRSTGELPILTAVDLIVICAMMVELGHSAEAKSILEAVEPRFRPSTPGQRSAHARMTKMLAQLR